MSKFLGSLGIKYAESILKLNIQYCVYIIPISFLSTHISWYAYFSKSTTFNSLTICPTRENLFWPAKRKERFDATVRCRLCQQNRVIVDESCCGLCLLGMRLPLRYECERCHGLQKIAHPMWRYQETVDAFGNDTWACHGRCGDFTKWRVYAADAGLIPPEVSHYFSPGGIK